MTLRQWLAIQLKKSHDIEGIIQRALKEGRAAYRTTILSRIRDLLPPDKYLAYQRGKKVRLPCGPISIDRLVRQYDYAKELRKYLSRIPAGKVMFDDDMRRAIGAPHSRWRAIVLASNGRDWAGYRMVLPNKRIVWGRRSTIAQLQQAIRKVL